jgi:hypothetical protein
MAVVSMMTMIFMMSVLKVRLCWGSKYGLKAAAISCSSDPDPVQYFRIWVLTKCFKILAGPDLTHNPAQHTGAEISLSVIRAGIFLKYICD